MSLDMPHGEAAADPPSGLRLTAMSIDAAAAVLRKAGARHVDVDAIRTDLAAGAPSNADGTINLLAYAAWMLRELARREGGNGL